MLLTTAYLWSQILAVPAKAGSETQHRGRIEQKVFNIC